MITEEVKNDKTGLDTYDYIVNNLDSCKDSMEELTTLLLSVDTNGQYLVSTAMFLNSVDSEGFKSWIERMIAGAIDKDRERKYIGRLLDSIWGPDYRDRSEKLRASDDNFRRIYKRIYPEGKV